MATSPVTTAVIACRDLHKAFPDGVALTGATCEFPRGGITALLGPSGAGKTTMMRLMLGVLTPDRGEVRFEDRVVAGMSEAELADMRRGIGVLQEGPGALFSSLSVFDNVAFPLKHDPAHAGADIAAIVEERLTEVGLAHDADKRPEELSVGMRVRAALARAMALNPHTLICDSLEYGMDPVWSKQLYGVIREKHGHGIDNVILITHDVDAALAIADHAVILNQGKVVAEGAPRTVRASTDPFVAPFLRGDLGMAQAAGIRGEDPDESAQLRLREAARRAWWTRAVIVLVISAILVVGLYIIDFPSWPTGR